MRSCSDRCFSAQATAGLGYRSFLYGAQLFWHNWDMFYSLSKAVAFGLVIPLVASHMGLATRGGIWIWLLSRRRR